MSVNGSAFLPPFLSVQWGFPGQQSVGTEAHLDPWEMSFFIFSLWNSGLSLSHPLCCQTLLSPSCLIPPRGTCPAELPRFFLAPKTLSQTQYPVSDWTMPGNSPSLLQSPGQEKQWWVVKHAHRKHHLHLTLGNAVQRCSPYRSLSQCCLYCYQKKSLQQWADGIVHLTYTRHCFVCSWLSCLLQNHFYNTEWNLSFGGCCCLYGTRVEWYRSNALDYCGNATQESGEGLGYKNQRAEMVTNTGTSL